MSYHVSSNVIVEMGQQLIQPWGDKEWLHQGVQNMISIQHENQAVITHWVELCGKKVVGPYLTSLAAAARKERVRNGLQETV